MFESEQFFSGHPVGWGILATANHGQTVGLDLDAWFSRLTGSASPRLSSSAATSLSVRPSCTARNFTSRTRSGGRSKIVFMRQACWFSGIYQISSGGDLFSMSAWHEDRHLACHILPVTSCLSWTTGAERRMAIHGLAGRMPTLLEGGRSWLARGSSTMFSRPVLPFWEAGSSMTPLGVRSLSFKPG